MIVEGEKELRNPIKSKSRFMKIIHSFEGKITGPADLFGGAEPSLLFYLWGRRVGKMLDEDWQPSALGAALRQRVVYPIIKLVGRKTLTNPQIMENRNRLRDESCAAPDPGIVLPDEPVIFCANHGFKDDIAATVLAAPRAAYIFFGSLPMFLNTFDGVSAYLTGSILCNRKVAANRKLAAAKAAQTLKLGKSLIMFPEGVWNKTPNRLLLPLFPGVYRLCRETGAKVVPIVHYIRDTHNPSPENVIHTVVDEPIRLDHLPEKEALTRLRDIMGTWLYLMMERYGQSTREKELAGFPNAKAAWEHELAERTGTVAYYDKEIELCADYRQKDIPLAQDVYQDFSEAQVITPENARAVAETFRIVAAAREMDFQRRF